MTLAQRWVRAYTAGLPAQLRTERYDEITSDLYEQLAAAGGAAAARRAARRAIVGRTARGVVDDLVWRREVGRDMGTRSLRAVVFQAWWAPVAALVIVYDVALAAAVLADEESTMPGRVGGPALVLAVALAMAVGLAVRLNVTPRRPTHGGSAPVVPFVAVVAVVALGGLAAAGVGGPAVLAALGLICVAAVAMAAHGKVRSHAVADGLVLLGTLPALLMFWLVVPPILALLVIVGVLTSRAGAATAPTLIES